MRNEPRLAIGKLEAIVAALSAALAGEGFDGGDFTGMDRRDFEAALQWAEMKLSQRRQSGERGQ